MTKVFIFAGIGLIAGNYLYQAFAGGNYAVATERSVFQAVAILCCALGYGLLLLGGEPR